MKPMSRETFEQHGDEIVTAVRLILADSKRRRRFQLATVHEKASNELLVEALWTLLGPVVVYSTGHVQPSRNSVWVRPRQDRGGGSIAPLTGAADQTFNVVSRSGVEYDIWAVDLIRVITGDVDPATLPNHSQFTAVGNVTVPIDGDGTGALTFRRVATTQ
jgi:hypothetical protein